MERLKEKSKAYLIKNGNLIATVYTDLKNGTVVEYGYHLCKEKINANRQYNLLNTRSAKISRAQQDETQEYYSQLADEINPGEFHVLYDDKK